MALSKKRRKTKRKKKEYMFIIEFKFGRPVVQKGKVTSAFLQQCSLISKNKRLLTGKIYGLKKTCGTRLEFSQEITESIQQQFRNVWNL